MVAQAINGSLLLVEDNMLNQPDFAEYLKTVKRFAELAKEAFDAGEIGWWVFWTNCGYQLIQEAPSLDPERN